jgi:hypothetical protein
MNLWHLHQSKFRKPGKDQVDIVSAEDPLTITITLDAINSWYGITMAKLVSVAVGRPTT